MLMLMSVTCKLALRAEDAHQTSGPSKPVGRPSGLCDANKTLTKQEQMIDQIEWRVPTNLNELMKKEGGKKNKYLCVCVC